MKLTESSSGVIVEPEELTRTVALGCSVNHRTTHSSQNTQTSRTYGLAQGEMRTEKGHTTILDTCTSREFVKQEPLCGPRKQSRLYTMEEGKSFSVKALLKSEKELACTNVNE